MALNGMFAKLNEIKADVDSNVMCQQKKETLRKMRFISHIQSLRFI